MTEVELVIEGVPVVRMMARVPAVGELIEWRHRVYRVVTVLWHEEKAEEERARLLSGQVAAGLTPVLDLRAAVTGAD